MVRDLNDILSKWEILVVQQFYYLTNLYKNEKKLLHEAFVVIMWRYVKRKSDK